jgi:phospholipid/cholesterol/gamma-HCH transport system substrate-binding protein
VTGFLSNLARSMVFRFVLAGIVIIAVVVVAIDVTKAGPTYPLSAVYPTAPGLFPGAAVDVLGVKVGTVTAVKNVSDHVDVTMLVNASTKIPDKAVASLVAPQLLGQPDIDLNPGYTGGPHLSPHAVIPESRTSVPVSTDEVLKELQHTLDALNPDAVGDLITNLAQDLDGQGANLNKLISGAAGTIQVLADKGNDLGKLNGTLAQLTGTLDSDTSQIEQLVQQYDTVSTVLATHSGQLNDAITQLAGASTSLVNLLVPNLTPLEADVGTVTTVGRTLDRNLDSVDEILSQGNNLFQGAERAYDPTYNWLTLNLATSPGVSVSYVTGLLRDRLAGICRRLVANHATGLTATELASLNECGNPDSTFFNPLINEIPTILNTLTGTAGTETGEQLLEKGVNQIMNIAPGVSDAVGSSTANGAQGASGTTTTTKPATSTPSTTTTTTPAKGPAPCNLLTELLGCQGGTAASKTTTSKTPAAPKSGLGSLLSQDVTRSPTPQAGVALAASRSSAQMLTPASAALLPPLPSAHRDHKSHPGLLSRWAHDVRSWF